MATKKEKRAAALAKREAFMAAVQADGLAALQADKDRQAKKNAEMVALAQEVNKRHRNTIAQQVVANTKRDRSEVTVGEFLQAADLLVPIFSS